MSTADDSAPDFFDCAALLSVFELFCTLSEAFLFSFLAKLKVLSVVSELSVSPGPTGLLELPELL